MAVDPPLPQSALRLNQLAQVVSQLACPACQSDLKMQETCLRCTGCGRMYPIIDGIPALVPGQEN